MGGDKVQELQGYLAVGLQNGRHISHCDGAQQRHKRRGHRRQLRGRLAQLGQYRQHWQGSNREMRHQRDELGARGLSFLLESATPTSIVAGCTSKDGGQLTAQMFGGGDDLRRQGGHLARNDRGSDGGQPGSIGGAGHDGHERGHVRNVHKQPLQIAGAPNLQ